MMIKTISGGANSLRTRKTHPSPPGGEVLFYFAFPVNPDSHSRAFFSGADMPKAASRTAGARNAGGVI
jgi:hypothetical protein